MKIKRELVKKALNSLPVKPSPTHSLYFDPVALEENRTLHVMKENGDPLGDLVEVVCEDTSILRQLMDFDELAELLSMVFFAARYFPTREDELREQIAELKEKLKTAENELQGTFTYTP